MAHYSMALLNAVVTDNFIIVKAEKEDEGDTCTCISLYCFFFFFAISAIISFTIMRNKIMSIMNLKSK